MTAIEAAMIDDGAVGAAEDHEIGGVGFSTVGRFGNEEVRAPRGFSTPALQTWEPTLVLCFTRGVAAASHRRRIPREGLTIGREARIFEVPFRDPRMSGRHARIAFDGPDRIVVADLGSLHGTWVNGERIVGDRLLAPGDVLRMGDSLLVFATGPGLERAESPLVGSGHAITLVRRSIDAVATRKHAVVITGETGTGKEVVARAIHDASGREGPFIAVNCSTFTEDLLASELFGHVKGAFTGAVAENSGLFRAARGGTLLLDEMADLPLTVQAALLRVLETRLVRPVGGTRDIEVDVRVIATTNRELVDLVQEGTFRADLYARLAQWTIRTPQLRARREDIPELCAHLLPRVEGAGRRLSTELCEALLVHDWPLNVRGLLNILSIAVVSGDPDPTTPLVMTPEVQESLFTTRRLGEPKGVAPAVAEAHEDTPAWAPPRTLSRAELEELLTRFHGHVAAAARHVGMTRPKMYRLLGAHGIDPDTFRPARLVPGGSAS